MKVYISGPMTGYPEFNYPAFNAAARQLRMHGYLVVNPAELDTDTSKEWHHYMRNDIRELVDCDEIVTLPGWEKSRGATLEVFIGTQLGMSVKPISDCAGCPDCRGIPAQDIIDAFK